MAEIEQEQRGAVRILRINRPEARNSLNAPVIAGIGNGVLEADADPSVGAVIITGTGNRAFCAGMDLRDFASGSSSQREKTGSSAFSRFLREGITKPVIAAANASAVAGGFELLLACDLAVVSSDARFGLPEVKRSLFPAGGGIFLGRRIAMAVALEMTLTGDLIGADRAFALGLVNRVVPPDEVLDETVALAQSVTANGPLAIKAIKTLVRAAFTLPPDQVWDLQEGYKSQVFGSEDAREGAAAFVEKRNPVWKGQ